jgi:hypothetical protein
MRSVSFLGLFGLLIVGGCATSPTTGGDSAASVTVPPVVASAGGSFTLVPIVTLTNTTETPLQIVQIGSSLSNVRVEFDVFSSTGVKIAALERKELSFKGGGRVITTVVIHGDSWTWKSDFSESYAISGDSDFRIVACIYYGTQEFVSPPFAFRVKAEPNKSAQITPGLRPSVSD